MKTLVTAVVLLCHTLLSAQHPASVTDIARQYVDTLAAPGMHGRGYVQCGDSLAAEWLSAQFDRIGLEKLDGNRFQPFSFPVNTFPDSVKLRIGGKDLRPGLDFITDPRFWQRSRRVQHVAHHVGRSFRGTKNTNLADARRPYRIAAFPRNNQP